MRGVLVDCGPCPYLPERRFHAFQPTADEPIPPYRALMDVGFRRSGDTLYAPICPGCRACEPIRVDVTAFSARKNQRRCQRRNADIVVTWAEHGFDPERAALFSRYERAIHQREDTAESGAFLSADGGIDGGELHARSADGTLLAVSIVDRFDDALSSVYCYYDPDLRERTLGTFMVLAEIAAARAANLRWLYLGFHVAGAPKMTYKARFVPHEILSGGAWRRVETPALASPTQGEVK